MLIPRPFALAAALCALLLVSAPAFAQPADDAPSSPTLGTISFPTSASGAAQEAFRTGVLALHSFWYPEARDHFQQAQQLNPRFAMAYWGEALTYDHPLWGPLGQHDRAAGQAVLARLDSVQAARGLMASPRERAYLNAVRTLYNGEGDLAARRRAYTEAMDALAVRHPDDLEATVLAALARMARPGFDQTSAADVVAVAAPLEEAFLDHQRHPGVLHYLIHAYDSEAFAPMGLRQARIYADIAPASSHALHMPSHIFRALEQWEKVVASNQEAYRASVDWQQRTNRPLHMRDFHAYSWLFDAYLELGRLDAACQQIGDLQQIIAQARAQNEDLGRMPSLLNDFRQQYRDAAQAAEASSSCASAQ